MTFKEAGAKGGTALFKKVGREGMSARGKLGGRPRKLTYQEMQERGLLRKINVKEVVADKREMRMEKSLELVATLIRDFSRQSSK